MSQRVWVLLRHFRQICLGLLLCSATNLFAYESNYSGFFADEHQSEFSEALLRRFFIQEQNGYTLDKRNIEALLQQITALHQQLKPSIKLSNKVDLIARRNLSNKKAEKKATEHVEHEPQLTMPFVFLEQQLRLLLEQAETLSQEEIRNRVSTIAMVYTAVNFLHQDSLVTQEFKKNYSFLRTYKVEKLDYTEQEAWNLGDEGGFYNQTQLQQMALKGTDLSELDPPNSALWSNTSVEAYQADAELAAGEQVFPPATTEFKYDRMGRGQIKIKADYSSDPSTHPCEKPAPQTKFNATLRVGNEVQTQMITTHLARALGYPALPVTYRKSVTLHLCNTSFEEFLAQWRLAHDDPEEGSFYSHGDYDPQTHKVHLRGVLLEAYPGEEEGRYIKGSPFRSTSMDLNQRREWRALMVFHALIALEDFHTNNFRLDFYKPKDGNWQPIFFFNDLGRSLGHTLFNKYGAVNDFPTKIGVDKGDRVRLYWRHLKLEPNYFRSTTYADARWLIRRLARLTDAQIDLIVDQAGHHPAVAALYKYKLKTRIMHLIELFDLKQELQTDLIIPTPAELNSQHPDYIDTKGKLLPQTELAADDSRPMGNSLNVNELIGHALANVIHRAVYTLADEGDLTDPKYRDKENIELKGLNFNLGMGIKLQSNRRISINAEKSADEHRYLAEDTAMITLPIGLLDREVSDSIFGAKLPLGIQHVVKYHFYHSHPSLGEAFTAAPFKRLLPWSLKPQRERLQPGEGFYTEHYLIWGLNHFSLEYREKYRLEVSPYGIEQTLIFKKEYIYHTGDSIDVVQIKGRKLSQGPQFDWHFGIHVLAGVKHTAASEDYNYYRFDLRENPKQEQAFEALIFHRDASLAASLAQAYEIRSRSNDLTSRGCFLFWCASTSVGARTHQLEEMPTLWKQNIRDLTPGTEPLLAMGKDDNDEASPITIQTSQNHQYLVLQAYHVNSNNQDLSRLWTDGIDGGLSQSLINFLLQNYKESSAQKVQIDFRFDAEQQKIKDLNLSIQLLIVDNLLDAGELDRLKGFYGRRVYCNNREKSATYIDYQMAQDQTLASPFDSLMSLQIGKKGLRDLLKSVARQNNPSDCNKWCLRALSKIVKNPLETLDDAQDYARDTVRFIKLYSGRNYRNLGCVREKMNPKHYWLTTRMSRPYQHSMPLMLDHQLHYYAPEIGRYQGADFITDLQFKAVLTPLITRASVSPTLLSPTSRAFMSANSQQNSLTTSGSQK